MSYGLKYTGTLINQFGQTVEINILERDYTGSDQTVTIAGCDLTMNGDDENIFIGKITTSITVGFLSETNFQFIDLFSADKRKFRMKVYIDASLYWQGWVVPDLFTEQYTGAPYITKITARCGLAELDSIPFTLTGMKSQVIILLNLFGQFSDSVSTSFKVGVNTFEENHITSESPLSQTYVDCDRYEGLTYDDVLTDLMNLYGARCYQKDGVFHFVTVHEFRDEITITNYSSFGLPSQEVMDTELLVGRPQNDKFAFVDQQLNILPAWKERLAISDLKYKPSALLNYDFESWNNSGIVEDWIESSVNQVVEYTQDKNKAAVFTTRNIVPADGNFIKQEISNIKGLLHGVKISIRFGIVGDSIYINPTAQFWLKVENVGASDTKYLYSSGTSSVIWVDTESYINFQNIGVDGDANSLSFKTFTAHSRGLNAASAKIPLDGKLIVSIYAADYGSLVVDDIEVTLINYPFLYSASEFFGQSTNRASYDNYDDSPIEKIYPITNNAYIPDDLEMLTGDLPNKFYNFITGSPLYPNEQHVYVGGLFLDASKVNATHNWNFKIPPAPSTFAWSLIDAIYYQIIGIISTPQWAISGSLLTKNISVDSTIVDYQINNKKYLTCNGNYDLDNCIFNGTFIQIGSYSGGVWILEDGTWRDENIWIDTETWKDGADDVIEIDIPGSASWQDIDSYFQTGDIIETLPPNILGVRLSLREGGVTISSVPHTLTGGLVECKTDPLAVGPYSTSFKIDRSGTEKTIIVNVNI